MTENEKKLLVELICNEQTHMIIKDHTSYDTDEYKELEALVKCENKRIDLEISNLKHIHNLIRKKDKNIGEINIRKAHDLLMKLSNKFKIKY